MDSAAGYDTHPCPSARARQLALQLAGEREFESDYSETSLADQFAVSRHAMAIRLMQGLVDEGSQSKASE